ncbi:aminopeptidase N [Thiocapsa imhoffii]|uniref:Aminopeptidase N n=1 Tax=Thiocapsa imhoffii TaxID=382777 RepID=A0A9X0WKW2_9GAMM|nr:aminopeptidase N [Thiocapsa imhoffii]MBK1645982.1 aminopeptidase N [Thiocapsa imhoffii]
MYRDRPHPVRLADYRPPEFLIERVDLTFELDEQVTTVHALLEFSRNPAATRGDGSLTLDGEQLELIELKLAGQTLTPAEYQLEAEALRIHRVPDRFQLETQVRIHPNRNTALEGLYQSGPMLCTQCEAEGFRKITFFLDRPDVLSRFRTTLIADQDRFPVLLANGNLVSETRLPAGRHQVIWDDPFPKPCYLFALIGGDLSVVEDQFRTCSGRDIGLRIFVEPHNLDRCGHAMQALKKAMRWDEERFGREYDLDLYMIVAVSHFNMGAMENKGLNVFNDKFVLASPDTATDEDFQGIESVIAHEYFHNWTGNRITCRDWFQLSLKEGFTVYRDQEFSAEVGSRDVQRIADARFLRNHQFPEDAGPMAHPVRPDSYIEINNFYTPTVYNKGAELVRMQACLLGPELFRRATDRYFERHDGQAVTTDDFVRCIEEVSGRDLAQFRRWYAQAGTPYLDIEADHDATRHLYRLRIRQWTPPTPGQPVKEPLHLPFALGLLDDQGRECPVRLEGDVQDQPAGTRVLELRELETEICVLGLRTRPVPSMLRGFSAPVKLRYAFTNADLIHLMRYDRDGFCRWDAAQRLQERLLLRLTQDPTTLIPDDVVAAFRDALRDPATDPALIAELLTFPSESYLADQLDVVDVDGIHRAHRQLASHLGTHLNDDLMAAYAHNQDPAPTEVTPRAIGRRRLKNRALALLMAVDGAKVFNLCQTQFETADNMTDTLAALRLLVDHGGAAGDAPLQRFYERWSQVPLVIDKWFSVQASSCREGTVERVRGLMAHPDFSLRNPNRVRSLIGALCHANSVQFHAADGSGYRLLSDVVLELDPLNPQIAARLLKPILSWRRYDAGRQAQMRRELARVLETGELSADVYEVASKALDTVPEQAESS